MGSLRKKLRHRWGALTEMIGSGLAASLIAILAASMVAIAASLWFIHAAPPSTVTITSGPAGSIFQRNAERYQKILARSGIRLKILTSKGSLENLTRLNDPRFHVDIGFVQTGLAAGMNVDRLVSLGSIAYEPLLVFYRGGPAVSSVSDLKGRRIAVGPVGSGTRTLALEILKLNGITPGGTTQLLALDGRAAADALIEGRIDCAFLMGESASPAILRELLHSPGIDLMDFRQADAYTRRFDYLNKLVVPMGVIDFGKNIPAHDIHLIAPTVELVARAGLHPALSDLLIDAARQVNGRATVLQRRGEFPAPLGDEFRISSDALRYYKSGKSFLYSALPFWVASLVDRVLAVLVPIMVLLIPSFKILPALYSWRIKYRIYHWYGALLDLERDLHAGAARRDSLLRRLDAIEEAVNRMKIPVAFADQLYVLRDNIRFVRERIAEASDTGPQPAATS